MYKLNNRDKCVCRECKLFFTTSKTNHLCSYCNPNSSKRTKTKEERLKNFLLKHELKFINDRQFTNDCCLKYRPDFFI